MQKVRLGDMLVDENIITTTQLNEAVEYQKTKNVRLGEALVQLGFVSEEVVAYCLERQLNIRYMNLEELGDIAPEVITLVPMEMCTKYSVIPVRSEDSKLSLAMVDPLNIIAIDDVRGVTGLTVEPVISTKTQITDALEKYHGAAAAADKTEEQAEAAEAAMDDLVADAGSIEDELEIIEQTEEGEEAEDTVMDISGLESGDASEPVVKVVNLILTKAVQAGASDIHLEPFEKHVRCRFRIDGVLHEVEKIPKELHSRIISRVKIMAGLKIMEHRLPQDGRMKIRMLGRERDIRISVVPLGLGEKVEMRIFDSSSLVLTLEDLGLLPEHMAVFEKTITEPHGMILITGPTGCGKTTSLYTAINHINKEGINITTMEDPVEIFMEGVNQVGVRSEIGLTYASGLRAFLRQDPDVIMVGELRDQETGNICIEAALTGHLVFGTLHTNDAPSTITRLVNMGLESFLVSSVIMLVANQRLIRRVCGNCKAAYQPSDEEKMIMEKTLGDRAGDLKQLYKGEGCAKCTKTGFKGRLACFELMSFDEELRQMITDEKTTMELRDKAVEKGMLTLRQTTGLRVIEGETTIDEMVRVGKEY